MKIKTMKFLNLEAIHLKDFKNNIAGLLAAIEREATKKGIILEAEVQGYSCLVIKYKRSYPTPDIAKYQVREQFVIGQLVYKNVKEYLEIFLDKLVRFVPLIEGELIRPPINIAEAITLLNFLQENNLYLTKEGWSYFVNGFVLQSQRPYTDYYKL